MPSQQENPIELQDRIMSSKGWLIASKIRPVGISLYVFNQNYNELKQFLVAYAKPDVGLEISRVGNRKKFDAFMMEVTRRLHNYLASAMSLVDHTFLLVRALYKGTAFEKEYHVEKIVDSQNHRSSNLCNSSGTTPCTKASSTPSRLQALVETNHLTRQ